MLITRLRIFVRGPLPDLYLTVSCPAHLHTPLGAPIHLAGGAQVEDGNNFGVSVQVPLPLSSTLFSRYPRSLAAPCMTPGLSSTSAWMPRGRAGCGGAARGGRL